MKLHPDVNYRYLVQPASTITNGFNILDFSIENTGPVQTAGKADAKTLLDLGEGYNFNKLKEYIAEQDTNSESPVSFFDSLFG